MRKHELKKTNGITLMALMVTVIVLLILATITISTLSGENGLIEQTKKAKVDSEVNSEMKLVSEASHIAKNLDKYGDVTQEELVRALKDNAGEGATTVKYYAKGEIYFITFTDSQRIYEVTSKGYVKYMGTQSEVANTGTLIATPPSNVTPKDIQTTDIIIKTLVEVDASKEKLEYSWSTSENEIPSQFKESQLEKTEDSTENKATVSSEGMEDGEYFLWVKATIGDGEEIIEHFGPYVIG